MTKSQNSSRIKRVFLSITTVAVAALLALPAMADVPVSITQQGRILDGDEPLTGAEELEFALYDQESGGALLWSDVINADLGDDGVYTATLGDESNPIDAAILQDGDVYLQLTAAGEEFPDRFELTSVPFAAISSVAQSVADGAVTADALASNAVTSDAIDSVGWSQITGIPSEVGEEYDALAELNCNPGQFPLFNGDWDCADYDAGETYSGDDFALSNQACGAGDVVAGINADGSVHCVADQDTTYSGDDFALSNQACGAGDVVVGINADGSVDCVTEQDTTYSAGTGLGLSDDGQFSVESSYFDDNYLRSDKAVSITDSDLRIDGEKNPELYFGDGNARFFMDSSNELFARGWEGYRFGSVFTDADFYFRGGDAMFDERIGANSSDPQAALHVKQDLTHRGLILERRDDVDGWIIGTGEDSGNFNFYNTDDATSGDFPDLLGRIFDDTGEYAANSDRRVKRDIDYIENVLQNVLALEPASYRMKYAGPEGSRTYGLMAQQVEEVFPEIVRYDEDHDLYSLSYDSIAVLAVQAVREQQEIIDEQQERLDALEERISALESR